MEKYLYKLPEEFGPDFEGLKEAESEMFWKERIVGFIEGTIDNYGGTADREDVKIYKKGGDYYICFKFDPEIVKANITEPGQIITSAEYAANSKDYKVFKYSNGKFSQYFGPGRPLPKKKNDECIVC